MLSKTGEEYGNHNDRELVGLNSKFSPVRLANKSGHANGGRGIVTEHSFCFTIHTLCPKILVCWYILLPEAR